MPRRRNTIPLAEKAESRHRRRDARWREELAEGLSVRELQKRRLLLALERDLADHEDYLRNRRIRARWKHFERRVAIRKEKDAQRVLRNYINARRRP